MSTVEVKPPFAQYNGLDGLPLESGYLYIGTENLDPITNPITVYWDSALSITAAQPIRLINGYPSNNGTAGAIFTASKYSVKTKDSNGSTIFSSASEYGLSIDTTLRADLAASSGSALVGFLQAGTGTQAMTVNQWAKGHKSLWDYIPAGTVTATTDCSDYIQAAIDDLPSDVSTVVLPANSKIKFKKPLVLRRGQSIIGDSSTDLIADFSGWTGDLVAIKFLVDSTDSGSEITNSFGPVSGGFRLVGMNNASIITTGIKFYTSLTIAVSAAVQHSYLAACFRDVTIMKFDTALYLQEVWQTNYIDVQIAYCRQGIKIAGKCANVTFYGLKITNPDDANEFTSSTDDTVGVEIDSGFHYTAGAEGRPEGLAFIGGLIYGSYYNARITRCLQVIFDGMIVDGAAMDGFYIASPDMITINNCYIYTSGAAGAGIRFLSVASGANSHTTITNNRFVGYAPVVTDTGIKFVAGGATRANVIIDGNTFVDWTTAIDLTECPTDSIIRDNHGSGIITNFILVTNGGAGTVIDGNTTTSSIFPLVMHPTATSDSIVVGYNRSATNSTLYNGSVTLTAGATSISLTNDFYTGSTPYVLPYTKIASLDCAANPGVSWYQDLTSWSAGTFRIAAALAFDLTIRYTVTAVSYTKFY
jgi:hypothetical protein